MKEDSILEHVKKLIEQAYYIDLSVSKNWDRLVIKTVENKKNMQENIECQACIGFKNVKRFVYFAVNLLTINIENWFSKLNPAENVFLQRYFTIICYLRNIDISAALMNEPKIIIKPELIEAIKLMQDSKWFLDTQFLNHKKIILEMLLIPFLGDDITEVVENFNASALQKKLREKIAGEINFENAYDWLENPNFTRYKKILISAINICYLMKIFYFHCGSHKIYRYYYRLIDMKSDSVLYSIHLEHRTLLLRGSNALIAGEVNVDKIEILEDDVLLISFKKGLFIDETANIRAALNIALMIDQYFGKHLLHHRTLNNKDYYPLFSFSALLEAPSDNAHFAENILEQLKYLNPNYEKVISTVPTIKDAPIVEKKRYLHGNPAHLDQSFIDSIVDHMHKAGQKKSFTLTERAFQNVKLIRLDPGEVLFCEGDKALFAYIPMGEGLEGFNRFGHHFFPKPWAPLGHSGIIQALPRSATIITHKNLELLIIPSVIYLSFWYLDYDEEELRMFLTEELMKPH